MSGWVGEWVDERLDGWVSGSMDECMIYRAFS